MDLYCNWKYTDRRRDSTRIRYAGAIDEFPEYRFGPLPYRSLRFAEKTLEEVQHQSDGMINYPNDFDYTRTTEQKIITGRHARFTTLVTVYP